jgi:hypothetical protein
VVPVLAMRLSYAVSSRALARLAHRPIDQEHAETKYPDRVRPAFSAKRSISAIWLSIAVILTLTRLLGSSAATRTATPCRRSGSFSRSKEVTLRKPSDWYRAANQDPSEPRQQDGSGTARRLSATALRGRQSDGSSDTAANPQGVDATQILLQRARRGHRAPSDGPRDAARPVWWTLTRAVAPIPEQATLPQ